MAAAAFHSILPSLVPFRLPRRLQALCSRALGIDELARIYEVLQTADDRRPIAERLLEFLAVSYTTSPLDLSRIPRSGPAIITANHPFGILEGAILSSLLGQIRGDVRFLANGILTVVPELRQMVLAVDPISGARAVQSNGRGLRRSLEHLRAGGILVMFPAGEVSHLQWKDGVVADREWNPIVARLVKIVPALIIPAYVDGANGPLFQAAGIVHPALRTALLARELLNKRGRHVEVCFGAAVSPEKLLAISAPREQADYLRWRTYLLAGREGFKPQTALPLGRRERTPETVPVAAPEPPEGIAEEITALPGDCLLTESRDLRVYLAEAREIPKTLREIGRLRELTFRAAGEGSGRSLDLDRFDEHYLHLFVWNAGRQELIGAYRLAPTDAVRKWFGVRGLYTASLFRYGDRFLDRLGPALELGRSFVRQEYQKGFAPLLLLWKGVGAFIAKHPRYRTLFGAVSISNRYEALSRELMVSFLERYELLRDWTGLVRNRRAFREKLLTGIRRPAFPESGFNVDDLSAVVNDIQQEQAGVPVLLRQYLKLGGKLLGFSVDPKFAHTLDGLILVDLTRTEPRLLDRYLGKNEAAAFLEFQKGSHGTL